MSGGTVAITMAGMGSRFTKAGYDVPKYEIEALGRPLFDWSMLSLEAFRRDGWRFSFAVRDGLGAEGYIKDRAKVLNLDIADIVTLDGVTDGQATTALMLARQAPGNEPFAVYNIDTFVAPNAMTLPLPDACAGWVPCFPAPGEGWSFAKLNDAGQVVELREKQRISDHATVGLYWFDSATRYISAYDRYFAVAGREEKGERYIAPLYNQLIADDAEVRIAELVLGDVGMLGTPEQVSAFQSNPPDAAAALALKPD